MFIQVYYRYSSQVSSFNFFKISYFDRYVSIIVIFIIIIELFQFGLKTVQSEKVLMTE